MQRDSERSSLSKPWLYDYLWLLTFHMINKHPEYSQLLPRTTGFCILMHVSVTLECPLPWMMAILGSWPFVATIQRCHRKLSLLPYSSSLVSSVDWTHQGAQEPGKCPMWWGEEKGRNWDEIKLEANGHIYHEQWRCTSFYWKEYHTQIQNI